MTNNREEKGFFMVTTLENDVVRLTVDSQGAEIQSFILKETNCEYIWQADPQYWQRHAPILFPIVGKLKNNQYEYDGSLYNMHGHGFARDMDFAVVEELADKVTYELTYNQDTLLIYPFKFKLRVSYTLEHFSVKVGWQVINLDNDNEMFFSIGAHPAFNCPIGKEGKFEDHEIEFEQTEQSPLTTYRINSAGLFDGSVAPVKLVYGKVLRLNHNLFLDDALIFKNLFSEEVKLTNPANNHFVKVNFKGFPYLGIWTKPVRAPFVCIEPWYGLADSTQKGDLITKEGIIELAGGKQFNTSYTITIG